MRAGPSFAIDSGLLSWLQSALLSIFDNLGDDDSGISGLLQSWFKSSNSVATGAVAAGSSAAGAVVGGAFGAAQGPGGLPPLPPPLPPLPSGHPLAPWTKKHDMVSGSSAASRLNCMKCSRVMHWLVRLVRLHNSSSGNASLGQQLP
jgi:hypothetical protein